MQFSFLLAARYIGNVVTEAVLGIEHQTRRTVLHTQQPNEHVIIYNKQ